MPKTAEERETILEKVESAMLRGAFRVVDVIQAVPEIGSRVTAREYMDIIGERWAGRQSDNEAERQRLIDEKREIIRQAYSIISDSEKTIEAITQRIDSGEKLSSHAVDSMEVLATGAYSNKAKAMKIILDAQSGIAKLLGLEVKKVELTGNITEDRNATIAILTASAESHSIRGVLGSLSDSSEAGHRTIPAQPTPVALPASQGQDSQLGSATPVSTPEASPMGRND